MNDSADHRVSLLDARDNRRWLIGVCISLAFGLFGVVMALLSYSHRSPGAPSAVSTPAAHGPAASKPTEQAPRDGGDRDRQQRRHQR